MDETNYSKRELDTMFKEIQESLKRIEAQTVKTNGSVSGLRIWRGYITGGIAVLTVVVLPILGYLAYQIIALSTKFGSLQALVRTAVVK